MKRLGYGLAAGVFLLDQAVKYWIISVLGLQAKVSVPVLPFFSLTWVENYGVSMGMFQADSGVERWGLTLLTAGIAAFVGAWIAREKAMPEVIALGLVLGGAVGNILDRVRFGYVVDFVHLHIGNWSFYVFNVADAAISIGVALLLVRALLAPKESKA
ncbi:signal peptidase II [Sandaracinobacteroides saxicola]|uniref:signal peptidase II n=1 Tax=Sandaracinobacteroides saxicola TaxID=2759707 RepID=UPI001FB08778|nr:signal peptidase II [Sandaracinobacteroides saxicola]